jgi:hypothetical protein
MYLTSFPSGPDIEVVVHDNGTPDSDASGPVDIILVDETRSAVVYHTTPMWTTLSVLTGKPRHPPS